MAQKLLQQAATALRDGGLEALSRMLSRSPAVLTVRDNNGRTLLDLACRAATCDIAIPLAPGTRQQHAAIDLILGAGADPATADNDGWTPLHTAGMAGHADPDLRHDFGGEGHGVQAVAMHLAAQHNAVKCLNLLLDRGADPTIVDAAHSATPLVWAEVCDAPEAADVLRRRG